MNIAEYELLFKLYWKCRFRNENKRIIKRNYSPAHENFIDRVRVIYKKKKCAFNYIRAKLVDAISYSYLERK